MYRRRQLLRSPRLLGTRAFRLLLLTSATRDATSSDIADCNTFVQARADAGHAAIQAYSSEFKALGSTVDTDARDNTATTYTDDDKGVPIYWLGGSKVADDYEDLYDGSWDDEANPRGSDGTTISPDRVWTGSETDGTEGCNASSESRAFGTAGNVRTGRLNHSSSDPLDSAESFGPATSYRYYALSRVFTVGSQVVAVNSAPVFSDTAPAAHSVAENSAAGTSVGAAVATTDTDIGDTLVYSLGGTDAASFAIVSTSGQIQTKSGVSYDHETQSSYAVQVSVTDGTATVAIAVAITVTDIAEQPETPVAPSVGATANTTDSLDVSWTAAGLNGGPAPTGYELQYRKGASGSWSSWTHSGTGTTGVPGLSIADSSASEGAGTMAFAVTLSEAGGQQVTVVYATSGGSATQGTDYTAAGGTLTFAPGNTAQTISVTLTDDTLLEGDETFQVTLSSPQNAPLADATATGTITDNDQAATALVLSLDPDSVMENGGARSISVTVRLDGAPRATPTQVTVSRTGGTATSGTDYEAVSDFALTIPANQTSGTARFTFTPLDDSTEDGDETVILTGRATGLADGSAMLTITNDDQSSRTRDNGPPAITIRTDSLSYRIDEEIRVYLDIDPKGDVQEYTLFVYRESVDTGQRLYLAPMARSMALRDEVVHQYGARQRNAASEGGRTRRERAGLGGACTVRRTLALRRRTAQPGHDAGVVAPGQVLERGK